MNIETIRKEHTVRVCNGSGVIVRPLEKSYLYILTNYHVLFEADGQAKTLKFIWRTRQTLWRAVQMLTQKLSCQTIHDCPKVVPLHYESEWQ